MSISTSSREIGSDCSDQIRSIRTKSSNVQHVKSNTKCRYMFGHFELPYFKMNAMVEMPDHGQLNAEHLQGPEYVFTGHFHKRQNKGNVHYLGSPFPHNYADAWDDERGMMILEWGGKPEYVDFAGPRYRTVPLSRLIDEPDVILNDKTYCRATLDIAISYEEASFIKETFSQQYLSLIHI